MKFIPTLLTGFLIAVSILSYGQSIHINTAKLVAQNHLLSVGRNQLKSASLNRTKPQFSSFSVTSESKDTLYYVFNDTINHSFVIVSGDKRSMPIIGYSLEGNYDVNNQPPAFEAWMESREKEIASIKQNNLQTDSKIQKQWDKLSSPNVNETEGTSAVEPLLKTKWDQGCYYNSKCPSVEVGFHCGYAPTGCTATAMAQIMKYWNYPSRGKGSHSYLSAGYGILSADFGSTTYQWDQMPNELTSENDAVATLMYHCGVSIDMIYDSESSAGGINKDALVNYFNYSSNAQLVYKHDYKKTSDWGYILKSELDIQHPIWYSAYYPNCKDGGHVFVIDGYQNSEYFHFNWGWGGYCDGYFYLDNLNPAGYEFNGSQHAIINIIPDSLPEYYKGFFLSANTINIGTNGGKDSVTILSSTKWMASSNQPWLSISSSSEEEGTTIISISAEGNNTSTDRSATIIISASGYTNQSITINQPAKVAITPGGLHDLISSMPGPITNLTLSGSIDARDFKTMRDEMELLSFLDLSDVKVVEYRGTEGTMGTNNYFYPANKIPSEAFLRNVSLKHVVIGSSVTSIGELAFFGCKHLNTVTIPASITSIEREAFRESREMTRLTIPSSVTFIGSHVFQTCSALIEVALDNSKYSSIDGVLFNKTQTELIQYPVSKPGNYKIPSSIISIGDQAFWGNTELISVTIPSSVTTIRDYAFCESSKLTFLTIPSSVTFIGNNAFELCNALIDVSIDNPIYSSINGVIFNKVQTQLIHCPPSKTGNYVIPASVKSIADWAFSRCHRLTSLAIPSSNISIGTYAFFACDSLNSIYASGSSPANLNSSPDVFTFVNKEKTVLKVPFGSKSNYQTAYQWKDFANIVEINPPVADAGAEMQADENSMAALDGSASSDPDNGELTYYWTAPAGITLSSNTAVKPTFTAPEVTNNTNYTFALMVFDGKMYSTADLVVVSVKNVDKAPYTKSSVNNISVERASPDKTIGLQTIFADDDLRDVLSYQVTSNTNEQVVITKISGSNLMLSFSSQHTGISEITITANSNGKEVSCKFNVEVKIPTEINSFQSNQMLKIFPNPTNGKVKVEIGQSYKFSNELIVTDIKGNSILRKVIHEKVEWVDLTGQTPGIYLIKTNLDNTNVHKVILK